MGCYIVLSAWATLTPITQYNCIEMKGQACNFPLNDEMKANNENWSTRKKSWWEEGAHSAFFSRFKRKKKLLPHQQRWGIMFKSAICGEMNSSFSGKPCGYKILFLIIGH